MAVYLWLHIDFLSSSGGNSIAVDYRLTLRLPAQEERESAQPRRYKTQTHTEKPLTGWENAVMFLTVWKCPKHSAKHMFSHPLNTLPFLSLTHTLNYTRVYDRTRTSKSLLSGDERFIGLSLLTDAALLLSFFLSSYIPAHLNWLIVLPLKDNPPLNICFTVNITGEVNPYFYCH